jgi:hypothetical protein
MSVEQVNQVDFVSIERSSNIVVLTVSDHLDWSDELSHVRLLREKLDAYLRFVEGGELMEQYPQAHGRSIAVEVVCKHEPTALGREFFGHTSEVLRAAQLGFRFRLLSTDLSPEPPTVHT